MKRLFMMVFAVALFALTPAFAFASGDKNCSDFKTWSAAQSYFESHGGSALNNVDGLDRDHDGLACESLKGFKKGHKNPNDNPVPTPPKEEPKPTPTPQPTPTTPPADNTKPGGKMPKTASPYANSMAVGSILLIGGVFMLYRKKPTT